jgi:hypothetical protein
MPNHRRPSGNSRTTGGFACHNRLGGRPLDYGQDNRRQCKKCQPLFFAGNNLGVCAAGGSHEIAGGSTDYTLVHNSPCHEPQ